jgi:hypothetical protein
MRHSQGLKGELEGSGILGMTRSMKLMTNDELPMTERYREAVRRGPPDWERGLW